MKERLSFVLSQKADSNISDSAAMSTTVGTDTIIGGSTSISSNNAIFDKVLKKHFQNSLPKTADEISNEDLWKILHHYQIEKGLVTELADRDKQKQAYHSYHIQLKDQLNLN